MNFETWWQTVGRHTSNHKGIARRAWEAGQKNFEVPSFDKVLEKVNETYQDSPEISYVAKIYAVTLKELGLEGKYDKER